MSKKSVQYLSEHASHALNRARVSHCLPHESESLRKGQVAQEVSKPSAANTPLCT